MLGTPRHDVHILGTEIALHQRERVQGDERSSRLPSVHAFPAEMA